VVVVGATVVVVVGVVEPEVSVVVGSLAVEVVDMGANVVVVDASSPDAAWHPAARTAAAATSTRERRICIGLRCYDRWWVKRSLWPRIVAIPKLALPSQAGPEGTAAVFN
jgi:hypothetical protein